MNSTFVVIMGAGRCGSTFVMNHLNRDFDTNIYGEDMGTTLSLLQTLFCEHNFLQHIQKHKHIKKSQKSVADIQLQSQIDKSKFYIGNEMYHNYEFHQQLFNTLMTQLTSYYCHCITGFKEIRWDLYRNLEFLDVLRLLYKKVKYIYLTRSDSEILKSSKKIWERDEEWIINSINIKKQNIETFLQTQESKNVIVGDVTKNPSFYQNIREFIRS